jgi:transcription elongation factor GreA
VSGSEPGAAELLRSIGLLADGPVRWGAPVQSRRAGLYVVELGAPLPTAPIELTTVGKWLERLPGLRLDGERPNSRALLARIAAFWWPGSTVLFAGATDRSIGGRVASLLTHVPGHRQPHPDGQWLHLLRPLDRLGARIWWAETSAPEEYLDAFLDAFGSSGSAPAGRPAGALALPWANLRRPTGERQPHGITGSVVPEAPRAPEPARRVVELQPGDADGARAEDRGTGTVRRAPQASSAPAAAGLVRAAAQSRGAAADPPRPAASTPAPRATIARTGAAGATRSSATPSSATRSAASRPTAAGRVPAAHRKSPKAPERIELSRAALERLNVELEELARVKRPEVVARIKSAREHGDLKENAEYQAAREEQSFLEGRIQALEDRLRRAVMVDETATGRVMMGSTVTVEIGGEELRYTIVGTAEADPAAGRLSTASPVGSALLGAVAGAEVDVRTPRGSVRYRVVSVD